jgi:hypothetical protein
MEEVVSLMALLTVTSILFGAKRPINRIICQQNERVVQTRRPEKRRTPIGGGAARGKKLINDVGHIALLWRIGFE